MLDAYVCAHVHECMHACIHCVCMHVFTSGCTYVWMDLQGGLKLREKNDYGEIHILRGYGGMFFGKKATQNSKKNSRMGVWCSFRVICICIINPKN